MAETLNANPTIRSTTDLPSRRRQPSPLPSTQNPTSLPSGGAAGAGRRGSVPYLPSKLLNSTIPAAAYIPDPFSPVPDPYLLQSPNSDSSDPGDDNESDSPDLDGVVEAIDEQEIYDLIAPITDPEHPLTLASLSVINLPDIHLAPLPPPSTHLTLCTVLITPTITHCSLATVIGLGVRVRLEQSLPPRFRVDVRIKEGTHSTAEQVTRQLGDKERVAAALENGTLRGVIGKMLEGCEGT